MDQETFERLLREVESTSLDFKRDQYPFTGVDRDQKSEIIKDILGFVNGWRRCEAFILIGVSETDDAADEICGVAEHMEDASLQQLVNAHLNRPIEFAYEAFEYGGKKIGVIRIPEQKAASLP